jgi:hypothetical protein
VAPSGQNRASSRVIDIRSVSCQQSVAAEFAVATAVHGPASGPTRTFALPVPTNGFSNSTNALSAVAAALPGRMPLPTEITPVALVHIVIVAAMSPRSVHANTMSPEISNRTSCLPVPTELAIVVSLPPASGTTSAIPCGRSADVVPARSRADHYQ